MKMIYKVIAGVLCAALIAAGAFAVLHALMPQKAEAKTTIGDIEGKIQDIGELSTAEYAYKISGMIDKKGLTLPGNIVVTSSKVIYSYEGTIKAGIQFGEIQIDINTAQKPAKVYVHIPEAEIFSNELDNDSLEIYDEKYSSFNKINFSDINQSQAECKEKAEEAALDSGILEKASENAATMIRSMLYGFLDSEEYDIEFY